MTETKGSGGWTGPDLEGTEYEKVRDVMEYLAERLDSVEPSPEILYIRMECRMCERVFLMPYYKPSQANSAAARCRANVSKHRCRWK